jgi:hypothetical protein
MKQSGRVQSCGPAGRRCAVAYLGADEDDGLILAVLKDFADLGGDHGELEVNIGARDTLVRRDTGWRRE